MPLTTAVTAFGRIGVGSVGDYLRAVNSGDCEPAELVVVAVGTPGTVAVDQTLDASLGFSAGDVVAAAQLTGKAGQLTSAVARGGETLGVIVFLGIGDGSAAALRSAAGELGRMLRPAQEAVTDAVAGWPDALVQAFAEGILLGSYQFSERSADRTDLAKSSRVQLLGLPVADQPPDADDPISTAATVAAAVALARDLTNTPSGVKSPQWLAQAAIEVAGQAGLSVRIWTGDELADAGFGGIVAVGAGSARPPALIELSYRPEGQPEGRPGGARPHTVLVGKGI